MKYKGFKASYAYDHTDKILTGEVTNSNHIIAFHGKTTQELETAFRNIIDHHIIACNTLNLDVHQSETKQQ
jgi:predicted HicB family RNase H-like nuclease